MAQLSHPFALRRIAQQPDNPDGHALGIARCDEEASYAFDDRLSSAADIR